MIAMRLHPLALAAVAAAAAACGAPPLPCGSSAGSTTVPGVTVSLDTETCSILVGSGATFDYTTKVTTALSFMYGPHSGCTPTFDDPKSFIATEVIGAGSQVYCPSCDPGTCSEEDPGEMITIPAGTYTGSLDWPGVEWNGPGDGNAPLGSAFPAGPATVHVVFDIPGQGSIDAQLPILLE